jgi:hypothetical protein
LLQLVSCCNNTPPNHHHDTQSPPPHAQDALLKEPGGKDSDPAQLVWAAVDGTVDKAFLQAPVLTHE